MEIGKVIGGGGNRIDVRLKEETKVSIGDLVIIKDKERDLLFLGKIFDIKLEAILSNQFLLQIAEVLEKSKVNFFDMGIRFHKVAKVKILKVFEGKKAYAPRVTPTYFSDVYLFSKEYTWMLDLGKEGVEIGYLRTGLGENRDVIIKMPYKNLISHHILISAATGKGKSNFAKVMLSSLMLRDACAAIVFDPHKEYFGEKGLTGLKDHPLAKNKLVYYTYQGEKIDYYLGEHLIIHTQDLEPDDFSGIVDLTDTQKQILNLIYRQWKKKEVEEGKEIFDGKDWLSFILLEKISNIKRKLQHLGLESAQISATTIASIKRKLLHALEVDPESGKGVVFTCERREENTSIFDRIIENVKKGKFVIIDTSYVGFQAEKIIASAVTNRVFKYYVWAKQNKIEEWKNLPELLILIEEAPRFIGKDVLAKGTNIFERIAREGRKFKVGLCAITQMPSLIPKEILSQLNTKIILGTPAPQDRQALIESAAHDLTDEDKEIQVLDKGEAIITSPFISIPIPVKIFLFEDYIKELKERYKEEEELEDIGY